MDDLLQVVQGVEEKRVGRTLPNPFDPSILLDGK
jgi:hypothetical protein